MDIFNKILHSMSFGLMKIVDMFMNVFYFFSGVTDINGNISIHKDSIGKDLLSTLFNANINTNGYKVTITTIYIQFAILALGVFMICFVIGLLKSFIGKKDEISTRNLVYLKTGQSLAWLIFMPVIFMLSLWLVSALIALITGILAASFGLENLNISGIIIDSCVTGKVLNPDLLTVNVTYERFEKAFVAGSQSENFNYWLFLLAGGCTLFGVLMATLTLVERIIHIFFYYLASPFVFAKMPLDEGKSFDQWKEMVIAKFFSLAGILICAFLFFIIMGMLNRLEELNSSSGSVVKLIFLIGGIFTFTKAGTLVANLISSNAGQFEGMSQNTSMGMLQGGMKIASSVGRGAFLGATAMGGGISKGIKNGLGGALNGISGTGSATSMAGGMGNGILNSSKHSSDGGFTGSGAGNNVMASIASMANDGGGVLAKANGGNLSNGNVQDNGTVGSLSIMQTGKNGSNYPGQKYASQGTTRQALMFGGISTAMGVGIGKVVGGVVKGAGWLVGQGIGKIINGGARGDLRRANKQLSNANKPNKKEYIANVSQNIREQFIGQGNLKGFSKAHHSAKKEALQQYRNDRNEFRKNKFNYKPRELSSRQGGAKLGSEETQTNNDSDKTNDMTTPNA